MNKKELNLYDYENLNDEIVAISGILESCNELFNNVGYTKNRDYLSLNLIVNLLDEKSKKVNEVIGFAFELYFENQKLKKELEELKNEL